MEGLELGTLLRTNWLLTAARPSVTAKKAKTRVPLPRVPAAVAKLASSDPSTNYTLYAKHKPHAQISQPE